jgi:hypothetical protein
MIIWDKNRADSNGGLQSTLKAKGQAPRPDAMYEALPTLPLAPGLAPVLGLKEETEADASASAISDTGPADAGIEIIRSSLEAIPTGSTLAFAADDLGALLLAGAPLVRGPGFYRKVAHLAQACFCSLSVEEEVGTITFHRC